MARRARREAGEVLGRDQGRCGRGNPAGRGVADRCGSRRGDRRISGRPHAGAPHTITAEPASAPVSRPSATAACTGPSSPRRAHSKPPAPAGFGLAGSSSGSGGASESAVGTVSALLRYSQVARRRSSLALSATVICFWLDHRGLRLLHALHVALAISARPEVHLMDPARDGLLGARRQPVGIDIFAQQFRKADDGKIDVAARGQRDAREIRAPLRARWRCARSADRRPRRRRPRPDCATSRAFCRRRRLK